MSLADWIEQFLSASGPFLIYIAMGAIVFVETGILLAFWMPGDSVLFAAGLLAARVLGVDEPDGPWWALGSGLNTVRID